MTQDWYLSKTSPYLCLNGRIHLFFIYCHCYKLIENRGDSLALGIVVVLTEPDQVGQPGGHVLQTQVFQFNTWNKSHFVTRNQHCSLVIRKWLFVSTFPFGFIIDNNCCQRRARHAGQTGELQESRVLPGSRSAAAPARDTGPLAGLTPSWDTTSWAFGCWAGLPKISSL